MRPPTYIVFLLEGGGLLLRGGTANQSPQYTQETRIPLCVNTMFDSDCHVLP